MMIRIDEIRVGKRIRALREEAVLSLVESIRSIGLQVPISVVPRVAKREGDAPGGSFELIVGNHRLEACKRLGWSEIECKIVQMEDAERELWEIEENLCRADLTELERGEHLARRKEIYETVHPETRRGANVGPQRHFVATEQPAFSEDTANKIGIDKRTVQRSIRRAEKIDEKVRDRIRDTPEIADSGVELDALAQLAPDQQGKAVALVKKGNATSIRHAKRILGVAPTPNKGAPPPPDMKPEEPAASTRSAKEQEILPGVFDQSISAPFTGGDPANPASAPEMVAKAVREFVAKAILHGDEGQRAWLLDAAECFLAGKPMPDPPPSGPRALTDEELKRLMKS